MHESRAHEIFNESSELTAIYWATRQLTVAATVRFHTMYCVKTYGSSWSVLNEFCNINYFQSGEI